MSTSIIATLSTTVSRWALVDGVHQAQSDRIAVSIPSSSLAPASREDLLWAISVEAEDNGPHGREAAARVAQMLQNVLSTERSPSITSLLRHALKAAHVTLEHYNCDVPPSQRVQIGVTCAAMHGTQLFVAQVQPAQAFMVHAARLHALPATPTWSKSATPVMSHPPDEFSTRLGSEPDWFHSELQAGDVLVLCSTNIVQILSREEMAQALGRGDAAMIAQALYERCRAANLRNAHVVVIKMLLSSPANEETTADAGSLPNQPESLLTRIERRTSPRHPPRMPHRSALKANQYRRRRLSGYKRLPSLWLSGLLILGIIAALIVVGLQQNRQREQRLANLTLEQVEQALTAASSAAEERVAQQRLAAAEMSLRSDVNPLIQNGIITETNAALWARYQQVLERYDQARAMINQIGFLDQLRTVATLPTKQGTVGRVVVGSTQTVADTPSVFYLDRANGLLYQQGQAEPILRPGEQIGTFNVRPVQEALWHQNDIAALDWDEQDASAYRVFLRIGDDWRVEQLNQAESLTPSDTMPVAMYDGNLYFWDRKAKQVWRYTSGQYGEPPVPWIVDAGKAALDQVVDIAVDGRLYLLNRDGSVLVFQAGQFVRRFSPPKLAVPLTAATRFIVTDAVMAEDGVTQQRPGYFYILDSRNERVLQIDKEEGRLVQQIMARTRGPLNQLRDVAVDEVRQTLYLANGPHVFQALLPEPAQAVSRAPTATPEPSP